ncbi:MAG: cellulose synthase catalytic subunit (UDP-forming), partial [Bryocella sp.]
VDDLPAIDALNGHLPVRNEANGLHIQDTEGFFNPLAHTWWKVRSSDHIESGRLETAGGLPDSLIEGIESPYRANRSVVLVMLKDQSVVQNWLKVFLKDAQSSNIQQSVAVLVGNKFISYRLGTDVYHVGSLNWWIRLSLLFAEFPWLVVVGAALICFLMAALLRALLRRHARRRLQGND